MIRRDKSAVVLVAPPGTGKTTLTENLIKRGFPIQHVVMSGLLTRAAGDISFDLVTRSNITEAMEKCELVDCRIATAVFLQNFFRTGFLHEGCHQFFDGMPRRLKQAEEILPVLKQSYSTGNLYLVSLNLSDDECVRRMMDRKREGETEEKIRKRLLLHHQESSAVVRYLVSSGFKCIDIDASGEETDTLERAVNAFYQNGLS